MDLPKTKDLEFAAVCIFRDSKTFMRLEAADVGTDHSAPPRLEVVNPPMLGRVIDVKEYGSERIYLSHLQGLGSVKFASENSSVQDTCHFVRC